MPRTGGAVVLLSFLPVLLSMFGVPSVSEALVCNILFEGEGGALPCSCFFAVRRACALTKPLQNWPFSSKIAFGFLMGSLAAT